MPPLLLYPLGVRNGLRNGLIPPSLAHAIFRKPNRSIDRFFFLKNLLLSVGEILFTAPAISAKRLLICVALQKLSGDKVSRKLEQCRRIVTPL